MPPSLLLCCLHSSLSTASLCCKLKLCLRMLSLHKHMHGVSLHTVEWLYLAVHLCLIHRLHSIPTTLQVSFFGTSQGNSLPFGIILHQMFRAIKSARRPPGLDHFLANYDRTFLFLAPALAPSFFPINSISSCSSSLFPSSRVSTVSTCLASPSSSSRISTVSSCPSSPSFSS